MKQKLLLSITFLLSLFLSGESKAQTLVAGDIAFIGYNTDDPDGFSFIVLKDMPAGQTLYFTEEGWNGTAWGNASESHLEWIIPTGINCGTIISVVETSPTSNTFTVTGGGASVFTYVYPATQNFQLTGGDQIIAYQSTSGVRPTSPIFIAGIQGEYDSALYDTTTHWTSVMAAGNGSQSVIPTGLVDGSTCISLFPGIAEVDNAKYNGTLTGTASDVRLAINTVSNWMFDDGAAYTITPASYPTPAVTCTASTAPIVTTATQTNLGAYSVTLGGSATDGGSALTGHGVVWSYTDTTPTIGEPGVNNVVISGTATPFSQSITSLLNNTIIYYSAYAINGVGTSYGTTKSFTTNAAFAVSESQVDVACKGAGTGSVTVTASGGKPPYSYVWTGSASTTNTATNLAAGNYNVIVSDTEGGSSIQRFFTIGEPATALSASITAQSNVTTTGGSNGSATVTATGGRTGYTYAWAPAGGNTATATGLTAGTYTVTIKDNNGTAPSCTITQTVTITQPAVFATANSLSAFSTCSGTASTSQNFNVSGSGLSADLVVTAPTGYEVSLSSGSGYGSSVSITPTSGVVGSTVIYARLTATASGGHSGNITVTSTGATTKNVVVTGTATLIAITTQPTSTSACVGNNRSFTVVASGATGYQWQVNKNDGNGYVNVTNTAPYSGATTTTLSITNVTAGLNGYQYQIVASGTCPSATSNAATLTVSAITATASTTPSTCFGGSNGTATVTPSGGATPYSYAWSASAGSAITQSVTGLPAGTYSVTITDGNSCSTTITGITVGQSTEIVANASQTNVSCNGLTNGSATVAPSGGATPYTYAWSNGATTASISGLAQGTYSVLIKDANQCEKTQSFTITQPTVLAASQGTINNVSCYSGANGSATVNVSGGITPYSYDWTGTPIGDGTATISGLAEGTYTVTVKDANLCETTVSFTITQPANGLTINSASQTNVACKGSTTGSAGVVVSGGTGTYTYAWAPSGGTAATATGLGAGTYTVIIKDANNCQTSQSFTITEPATALTATQGALTNVNCRGEATGSATVNVTGGTGAYTYSWAPSGGTAATATGLTAGTYIVTVTDASLCSTTQSFTLTQPAAILSATTASTGVSCFGGSNGSASVNVSGGTSGYTYAWAPLGGINSSISGRPAGNYTCTITDAKGCTLVKNITISTPTAITVTTSAQTNVSCNNGTNAWATVSATGGTGAYTYQWSPSGGNAATATSLTAGTYTVIVQDANTCQVSHTVTITQPDPLTVTPSKTNVLCSGQSNGTASVSVNGGTPGYTYIWSPSGGTAATATGLAAGNYSCLITDAKGCSISQGFTINPAVALVASTSKTDATCTTPGDASVTPAGGAGSYTYLWSPNGQTTQTISNLAAGNYSCLITDANGCTLTKNFTITTTNTLTATQSHTNVSCNGVNNGTATVVPAGAPGPYTYVWSPSGGNAATATGLTAGNYSVIITASNGCSIVKNFTITEPAALTATPTQTNPTCNGGNNGSASVSITGGTGAYTYVWTPTGGTAAIATGLAAGTYTVTIKDANLCQVTQSITITQPAAIVAVTNLQTNVSCNGGTNGSATISATGGTGAYTYAWAPSGGTAATATGLAAGTYTVTVKDANLCQVTHTVTITEPSPLTAVKAHTDVVCNGQLNGTATVTPAGGTAPYTYAWSPAGGTAATATGLGVGNYSVIITDAKGCFITESFNIAQPTALVATAGPQINLLCNGASTGSATVNVTGGTGAYTYAWAPSGGTAATATGLAAGTYTVTVKDANLCQTTQTFTITAPAALAATTSQTNVLCFGASTGTATVSGVTGGTGAYTYAWLPTGGTAATATGLAAGTYTVTVTDANNCTLIKTVTITQLPAVVVNGSSTNVTCNGASTASINVSAVGGTAGYTYQWSPAVSTGTSATGLAAGTYTVTATDTNGCTGTRTFTILQPTAMALSVTQTNILCNDAANGSATVTATGGVAPYTYAWSPTGGTAATATGLAAGTYTVIVTDALGCTATASATLTVPESLSVVMSQTNVTCYGTADGELGVAISGGVAPYSYKWTPAVSTEATATGLVAGNYSVTITDANGCTTLRNFSVTQPLPLAATITTTNVGCYGGNDGSAAAVISGGTAPYTFEWTAPDGGTPDLENLVSGTYTLTITDDNGCTITETITISQPLQVVINSQPQNAAILPGQNAVYTVSATNAIAYQWQVSNDDTTWTSIVNGGINPTYTGATTTTLTVANAPASYNGYSYRALLLYGEGCTSATDAALLTIDNTINAIDDDFSSTTITVDEGGIAGDVTANDLINNLPVNDVDITISITDNGGLFGAVIDADGNLIVPAVASQGTYTVTYTICEQADATNCSTAEAIVVVSEVSGIDDFRNISLTVYPNPASDRLFIKTADFASHNNMKVTIYDLNGRLVRENRIHSQLESVDVSGMESGVYLFNITSDAGKTVKRVVIDKKP